MCISVYIHMCRAKKDTSIPKSSMDSVVGEFHKVVIDGKPYLVYHNVMKPLPPIHDPNSSDEKTNIKKPLPIQNEETSSDKLAIDSGDNLPLPPLFICPRVRYQVTAMNEDIAIWDEHENRIPDVFYELKTSHLLGDDNMSYNHDVLPLFWCNNKEADITDCFCEAQNVGTSYYLCVQCDTTYHKECIESPLKLNYPSHVKHSLQFHFSTKASDSCILCRKRAFCLLYYCALCDIYMHVVCAQTTIPFFIDQPKSHDHTLTLFPRQASLTCNVCGLVNKFHLTYVCPICDFAAHSDCIFIPQIIRISRHHHRVSFTSSRPLGKWSCRVCRQEVDSDYGAYTCNVCSDCAVHTRCALRRDIWDGIELEGLPEEDEDVKPPFERISDDIILHFSHGCHLKFETSGVYNQSKFCNACTLSIKAENFYVCVECNFVLHETCADAPRTKVHPLHAHPLEQTLVHEDHMFRCSACYRWSTGFGYGCANKSCVYILDAVCASVSEPFDYQGHQHPLFLALGPNEKPMCHICKSTQDKNVLNCIECDFIICFECATLPYTVRYKHDEHYLTFCHGDEASGSDWCELCEGKLAIGGKAGFYKCNDCSTTLHIKCLIGPYPYLKPGHTFPKKEGEILIQRNNSLSRPFCNYCGIRCPYPVYILYREKEEMLAYIQCSYTHTGGPTITMSSVLQTTTFLQSSQ